MPISYLRGLSGRSRTPQADRHLAHYLTFVAGAVNAGGFLIVGRYTSHMTGIVSGVAKVSRAEIRTTHVTGMITDLGVELGKLLYWNRRPAFNADSYLRADRTKLSVLSTLTTTFFTGGVLGTLAFGRFGALAALPLAFVPFTIAAVPIVDDLRR